MEEKVQNFIAMVNPTINTADRSTFWTLVNNIDSDGQPELQYVKEHPEILTMRLKHHLVFDYFYEKVVQDRCLPTQSGQWQDVLLTVISLLNTVPDRDVVKHNKKYLLRLQGTCRTLTKIFSALVADEFEMGDPEFLVYSIIARGELTKLEILGKLYVIEDYPAVLDVALRYGRYAIIKWFKTALALDIKFFGKILDFENYKDNQRYIYYREHIAHDDTFRHKAIIGASKQDYVQSLKLILVEYDYPITCHTIDSWCDLIRSKEFVWDRINPNDVLPLLLSRLDQPMPLTRDFGEFNTLVFGHEWSDRLCLIEHCLDLQKRLEEAEARRDIIESRYRHLQQKYDTITRFVDARNNNRKTGRVRRETLG